MASATLKAAVLLVGSGQQYASVRDATRQAAPGDSIVIQGGTYAGDDYITDLKGAAGSWITICAVPGESVIYQGGGQAWHLVEPAYVYISRIIFEQQTGNGVNIDDGGTSDTPAHHVVIESCIFRDINATGNNDLLKLSGLDTFEVRYCRLQNGSPGGSGIDMVGCHAGIFKENCFLDMGSNAVQAKGGTRHIRYERNWFENAGARALNLGGSTGLEFFRPLDATYEAADLFVYANVFIGSTAPIAYVGCTNVQVVNNTIYGPEKWVIRILQETVDTSRFVPCGNNIFRNNIVCLGSAVSTQVNIGPDTAPETFTFSNNLWYHYENASWSGPSLPVTDSNNIVNQDPLWSDPAQGDFSLKPASPAIGHGYPVAEPASDYLGTAFNTPRSIGAFEGNPAAVSFNINVPVSDLMLRFGVADGHIRCWSPAGSIITSGAVYNLAGSQVAFSRNRQSRLAIDGTFLPAGIYIVKIAAGPYSKVFKIIL